MELFLQENIPLRHMINTKPLFISWRRSAFNEVNDWSLYVHEECNKSVVHWRCKKKMQEVQNIFWVMLVKFRNFKKWIGFHFFLDYIREMLRAMYIFYVKRTNYSKFFIIVPNYASFVLWRSIFLNIYIPHLLS